MSRRQLNLDEALVAYLQRSNPPEHPELVKLRAATDKLPNAHLQISPVQGHFMAFLVRLIGARRALEIGTFTGYSALTVALALPADGRMVACDVSEEWTSIGRPFWERAGVAGKIDLRIGMGLETLAKLEREGTRDTFDFAFIDADKPSYDAYYETTLRLVRRGGVIALDNMLMRGQVADPKATNASTQAVQALNAKIAADERVDRVLLPVGDGLTLVRRR
jgi:predicted O-methyltransferase YrrM